MFGQGNLGELALGQIGGSEVALPSLPTVIRNIPVTLDQIRALGATLYQTRSNAPILDQIRVALQRLAQ